MEMAYRGLLVNKMGHFSLLHNGVSQHLLRNLPRTAHNLTSLSNIDGLHVRIDCQAIGDLINFASGLSKLMSKLAFEPSPDTMSLGMVGASCLLMMRAIALWRKDLRVVVPLSIAHAVQWGVTLRYVFVARERWSEKHHMCVVTDVMSWSSIRTQYLYSKSSYLC